MKLKIYHNPKCSKSRQTLELLKNNGHNPEVIEYLKSPPSEDELGEILNALGDKYRDAIRQKEEAFSDAQVNMDDRQSVCAAILKHPKLMERPIVVKDGQVAIGRPPESVLKLFP